MLGPSLCSREKSEYPHPPGFVPQTSVTLYAYILTLNNYLTVEKGND